MGENRHVDKALVMTGLGLTTVGHRTIDEAQEYLFECVLKYPDRLDANPVINPRAWLPHELHKVKGWMNTVNLRMLKLHPSMHNYFLPGYGPLPRRGKEQAVGFSGI